jgi:L-lactate dehydrogenase complex protein LldF
MLACIRCGACLNVCPVFRKISGHAYDSVYSGPMGKILTPLLSEDGSEGRELPEASTLCGACTEACPVEIPLADLLVRLRADLRRAGAVDPLPVVDRAPSSPEHRLPGEGFASSVIGAPLASRAAPRSRQRTALEVWSRLWSTPAGYASSAALARLAARATRGRWTASKLPGVRAWTATRDAPLPVAKSFRSRWAARENGGGQW